MSYDATLHKHLGQRVLVHGLIQAGHHTTQSATTLSLWLGKKAIKTLCNLASISFKALSPYAPSITIEQRGIRLKVMQWGGLVCLLDLSSHCNNPEMKRLSATALTQLLVTTYDLKIAIEILKQGRSRINQTSIRASMPAQDEVHTITRTVSPLCRAHKHSHSVSHKPNKNLVRDHLPVIDLNAQDLLLPEYVLHYLIAASPPST
jgi:hypothetical protein